MIKDLKIEALLKVARDAGAAILEIYKQDFEVIEKADNSPLTLADQQSNEVIMKGLSELYPDVPVISEENKLLPYTDRKDWGMFWLVDPLDGTKEFIKKNDEFTVNIALIENGRPVFGIVYVPVTDVMYYGLDGDGSYMQTGSDAKVKLTSSPTHYTDKDSIVVVASRSHLTQEVQDFVDELRAKGKEVEFLSAGSSLKFCLVAEGKADVYPRFGPTMEWDTGAAHAVALGAGRDVLRADTKQPLSYNKEDLLNPWFIVE